MAQIPLGNGGRAVPNGSVSMPSTGQAEANAQLGQAVQNFGQVGMNAAADAQARQDAELRRQQQEEARRAEAQADAARKAADQNKLNETSDALQDARDEFDDGVRTGAIDKTQAETLWGERSRKIIDEAMPGISEQSRPLVQGQIERLGRRYGNDVRKSVTQRDRQDVTAGIDQTLEYAARRYKADPQGAQAQVEATLSQLGPFSLYNPQQLAAKGQAWKEGAQYAVAFEAVQAGRNDRQALAAAEAVMGKLPDLDPQRRAQLASTIDAYRMNLDQKDIQRAQRAELEAQRRDRKAAQAWDTATKLSLTGTLTDEYAAQAARDMAGTQYAGAFKQLLDQQRATGPLAAQSPAVLDKTLQQIDARLAQDGTSPELKERRDQIAKVRDEQRKAIEDDALGAALRYGKITSLPDIDMSSSQAIAASVAARVQAADITKTWTGKPASPLQPKEAEQLAMQFKALGVNEKAGMVAMLGNALPADQRIALAKQMGDKDRGLYHAMRLGKSQTSSGEPAARLVFLGQQFLKDEGKKDGGIPQAEIKRVTDVVGDMLTGTVRDDVIEAAALIQLGKRADGQSATARKSVEIAIGGPIIEHAGRKLPAAPGMTQDRFRDALAATGRELAKAFPEGKVYTNGGEVIPAADFAGDLVFSELQPAGLGRYYVRAGSGVALDAKGRPLVIEVN